MDGPVFVMVQPSRT